MRTLPILLISTTPFVSSYMPLVAHSRRGARISPLIAAENAIPPEKLADAWQRDEKAIELGDALKGCSLYLVGLGPKKAAVGRVLARRLPRYRCYDVNDLMCATYKALSGSADAVDLKQLVAAEPLDDVVQLAAAILKEVQPFSRTVVTTWDGAIESSDYMIMQQGIVVHVKLDAEASGAALPEVDSDATLESWCAGHQKADLTVPITEDLAADDAAFKVIDALLGFIAANPAKSAEWKAKADATLATNEEK